MSWYFPDAMSYSVWLQFNRYVVRADVLRSEWISWISVEA